jgi:peptidoglycan/LPS O-acetylase OafA/YrhL
MVDEPKSRRLLRGLTLAAFGAALAYLFFGEHRVHLLGYLPFLLLLACPLLHMTMHGGHGGHGAHGGSDDKTPPAGPGPPRRPHA